MGELAQVLRLLEPVDHPDLLVGADSRDDAAVWRLSDERALVFTADFITPIVDDPRVWGRVAAVNSLSDVYAMGGRPLLALNLVCWNAAELPLQMLTEVLAGAAEAVGECGAFTVGGHSIDDPGPKFGLAVIGEVHPDRVLRNTGLRPGDHLVLTKALGTGVLATAAKAARADSRLVAGMVESMSRTNAQAAAAALACGATGATDITGFGLLGHLGQLALASGVDVRLDVPAVPLLAGARELAAGGYVPGGSRRNLDFVADRLDRGGTDDTTLLLLADAQTSGGLLFGAEPAAAERAVAELRESGHDAAVIGSAAAGTGRIGLA